METIILWIMASYGMTSIIVWGSIFEKPRTKIKQNSIFFGDLISCTLCTSTWVGFLMSITIGGLTSLYFDVYWIVGFFFDGMFTAGSVWALNTIIEFFEENRFNKN